MTLVFSGCWHDGRWHDGRQRFFREKPFCRLSEALEAAADISHDIYEDVDVVIIPPDPSPDTDEEGDDDCTNVVLVNDVSGKMIKHDKCRSYPAHCGQIN